MTASTERGLPTRTAVILTALREEYLAVRSHLCEVRELPPCSGTVYEEGRLECDDSESWLVILAEIGVGNVQAARETERAVNQFSPKAVLFVGVAGGVKDVGVGDVVAATKVYGYESGKAHRKFLPRPDVGQSSYSMVQRARAEARKGSWIRRVSGCPDPQPKVHIGPIAAGEKVVASRASSVSRFLKQAYSDALAVEMEGCGFLSAVHANHPAQALIVRGISDLLSGKQKADRRGSQSRAAAHASAFAFEVLAGLPDETIGGESSTSGEYVIVLSGTVSELDKARTEALVEHLRAFAKDTSLTLLRIQKGSIKVVVRGTRAGFERLRNLEAEGKLSEELGFRVLELEWTHRKPSKQAANREDVTQTSEPAQSSQSRIVQAMAPPEELRIYKPDSRQDWGVTCLQARHSLRSWTEFHDNYAFCVIRGGTSDWTHRGREYSASRGTTMLVEPGEVSVRRPAGSPVSFDILHVDSALVHRAAAEAGVPAGVHYRAETRDPDIAAALAAVHEHVRHNASLLEIEDAVLRALVLIVERCAEDRGPATNVVVHGHAIQRSLRYLQDHLSETVTLDALAREIGYSKYHLVHMFTRFVGVSPHHYLRLRRLTEARRILERGVGVAEAGLQFGFQDAGHFSRTFRQTFGITPSLYVRSAAKTSFMLHEESDAAFSNAVSRSLGDMRFSCWPHQGPLARENREVANAIILVLSKRISGRDWVAEEIDADRERVAKSGTSRLRAVTLDDHWRDCSWSDKMDPGRIIDFRRWRDSDCFKRNVARLQDAIEPLILTA